MTPLLVSEARIKKYGVIEDNVDPKLINATTIMVQDIELQQILGTSLYKEICTQVNNSILTSLNRTLLDEYITDFLMNAVIAEGCITFLFRFSNKGPVTSNSDNDFPISTEQVKMIEAKWKGKADFYAKRLSLYLCEKQSDYPLYRNGNTEAQEINPKGKNYNIGINLNNPRR